jgi:hypothetical protein
VRGNTEGLREGEGGGFEVGEFGVEVGEGGFDTSKGVLFGFGGGEGTVFLGFAGVKGVFCGVGAGGGGGCGGGGGGAGGLTEYCGSEEED